MPPVAVDPPDDLRERYWGSQETIDEIADEYDVSDNTVDRWFESVGITPRPKGSRGSWPFDGDSADALKLLHKDSSLAIRFISGCRAEAYWLYNDAGTFVVTRSHSGNKTLVGEDDPYLCSLFEHYESRLARREDYESVPNVGEQ